MARLRFIPLCPPFVLFGLCFMGTLATSLSAQQTAIGGRALDPQGPPAATREKADTQPVSGIVVDPSGAVIAGATVEIRNPDGAVQRTTQSDANGSFSISGLPAGDYLLIVYEYRVLKREFARH